MTIIDIVAGKSIGPLQLGPLPATVRAQAKLTGSVGELDGLKFSLAGEQIDDVWIEDLRTFAGEVRFAGETLARDISLEQLKAKFGSCERKDVKGGVFFNCSVGVTIGCDFAGQGDFIQIRLKPR